MSSAAIALVLASAVLHATWNLFAKRGGANTRGSVFVFAFGSLTALLFAPFAISQGGLGLFSMGWPTLLAVLGSALLHTGYFVSLQRGYKVGDLSLVYPLARGGGPLVATIGAIVLFAERPSAWALVGTGLVVVATVVLAGGGSRAVARVGVARGGLARGGLAPGLVWGLITALFIGGYTLWDARSVAMVGVPPLLYVWWVEVLRSVILLPAVVREPAAWLRVWREQWRAVVAIAVLSPLAYLLVLFAFTLAPVTLVAPLREVGVLLGAWIGVVLLREGQIARRLGAAVLMVLGAVLLVGG